MNDQVTTSWKRRSDTLRNDPGAPKPLSHEKDAQLQAWEGEGGKTALSTGLVRILIVDNDIGSADSLEVMLHASGYSETRVAYSGHAALAIATDFQPDVVLLDLTLFDMNSYELAQSLREHAQSRDLRLIALTFDSEHAAREEARAVGFERYLVKPFAPRDLSNLLEMLSH
jgi:DNA-binding response OmpR family regulator